MSSLIVAEINLNDAFSGAVVTNEKTGDKWVNLSKLSGGSIYQNANKGTTSLKVCISERREADKIGNTHSVYLNQSKEEREAKKDKHYCGGAKAVVGNNQPQQAVAKPATQVDLEDFPF